ncbi:hypothetical protein CHU98_g11861 [Xylaria longipes]|nr:hypothetical protein CHU98_g11861 [Xylaria longipes]
MASKTIPAKKQQELQATYSNYKNTLQQLAQKIGDVEQESEEHKLVLETLEPLPEDRKCFRMINGVLVERTVKDVVPALKTNAEGLKKVLDDLVKQYKTKQDDLEKWKSSNPEGPEFRQARWVERYVWRYGHAVMWENRDGAAVFGPEGYRDTYLSIRPGVGGKPVLAFPVQEAGIHGLDVAYIGARQKLQSQAAEPSVKGVSMPNDKRRQGCRVCGFGDSADSRAGAPKGGFLWLVGDSNSQ